MQFIEESSENNEKGISIEACVEKAKPIIERNGSCLLLIDVKNSKQHLDRAELQKQLESLIQELNVDFDQYFPENNLATPTRTEKGFSFLLGDGAWTAINDSIVITQIADHLATNYPEIEFHFNVAEDGYDNSGTRTVK